MDTNKEQVVIKETENYKLVVGSKISEEGAADIVVERDIYNIVNKQYGVIEAEMSVLPQALFYIKDFQEALDKQLALAATSDLGLEVVDSIPTQH